MNDYTESLGYWDYDHPENILGFRLHRTCMACPEQYDVFVSDTQVAYFRLRHGHFTATVPDVGGTLVYQSCPAGDGMFADWERAPQLEQACLAVLKYLADHVQTTK